MPAAPPTFRRRAVAVAAATGAVLGAGLLAGPGAEATGSVANSASPQAVSGSYLVLFEEGERPDVAAEYGVRVVESYGSALNGVLIQAGRGQARRLAADPAVRLVEQNTTLRRGAPSRPRTQPGVSCGLDRIDQRELPLDGTYRYPPSAGAGVDVYIVDTGIDYGHPDLAPRATPGFDAFGGDGGDGHGNGTLMAGIVGGTEYGVAKKSQLISVKVLDAQGGGTLAGVVGGIDWITEHASGPSVANFVIGAPVSDVLDEAIRASIKSGVTYAVSAGASSDDVDNSSPAHVREAITVGSSDCADNVASFSNYGQGLDLYAPGVEITSDWPGGTTNSDSGTSVSAAHVAGAAAVYLNRHPGAGPDEVAAALDGAAVTGALSAVPAGGSPNKLLQLVR
ncbi:S8 family peptidase [Streptomyces polyrhachis]|uniref:S8 family peptidase n=1 Tax=Streptomyces polyrhachis TaxID=1282885 RepID=A0ABW2GPP6_9ACTN